MSDIESKDHDGSAEMPDASRRNFLKYSSWMMGGISLSSLFTGCGGSSSADPVFLSYPISTDVQTTLQRMLAFPYKTLTGLPPNQLRLVREYAKFGYGQWSYGAPLPLVARTDLMPAGYNNLTPVRNSKFLKFFTISDIHTTDKEAPNQLIDFQRFESAAYPNTSIYSPVMAYTTHVLDAAIQTVNALHKSSPFDFGISLGDTCNSTSYNELRWYIDVIDGKQITPSSGAHLGADTVDYQKPYQAGGLNPDIRWYQVLGNHDHFYLGSNVVDGDPAMDFRKSYISDSVWAMGNKSLSINLQNFPVIFDKDNFNRSPAVYPGVFDGTDPLGGIIHVGAAANPAFTSGPYKVTADPDRRSLVRSEWINEFFNTSTKPAGHGFGLVDKTDPNWDSNGFACYSFVPNPDLPLKIIVLDDTQSEKDGSKDIHGHGYLDAKRWAWLQSELDKGQAKDQLMIIAAHAPIGVAGIGSEMEWWWSARDPNVAPGYQNAVDLATLVAKLQSCPNLLAWIAGHRHFNTVKAFKTNDQAAPENGFWQVETCSLRDFPQQFRTFEVYLNNDYTVSIVTVNVDPAIKEGTPAATSRKYAIATQQIVQTDQLLNSPNFKTFAGQPLPAMDPTRPQGGEVTDAQTGANYLDPSIQYVDLSKSTPAVPYNASYNAELFKQLSPKMVAVLKAKFPAKV